MEFVGVCIGRRDALSNDVAPKLAPIQLQVFHKSHGTYQGRRVKEFVVLLEYFSFIQRERKMNENAVFRGCLG